MSGEASFQPGEAAPSPGACVPRAASGFPGNKAHIRLVSGAILAQPAGEPAGTTDEKPALASAGLTDQVESRRPYPPSSLRSQQETSITAARSVRSLELQCVLGRSFLNTPIRK